MSGLGSGELGSDQLHLVFFNDFLSSRSLCQFLICLEHLLEEELGVRWHNHTSQADVNDDLYAYD